MKALTLKQPWATLIFAGKDIENRKWSTGVRGRVAITSSGRIQVSEIFTACDLMKGFIPRFSTEIFSKEAYGYPAGCVLGTVEIVDCVTTSDSPWFKGKYGFVLRDPRRLATPIPVLGMLGFWDLPADIEQRVVAELGVRL